MITRELHAARIHCQIINRWGPLFDTRSFGRASSPESVIGRSQAVLRSRPSCLSRAPASARQRLSECLHSAGRRAMIPSASLEIATLALFTACCARLSSKCKTEPGDTISQGSGITKASCTLTGRERPSGCSAGRLQKINFSTRRDGQVVRQVYKLTDL